MTDAASRYVQRKLLERLEAKFRDVLSSQGEYIGGSIAPEAQIAITVLRVVIADCITDIHRETYE